MHIDLGTIIPLAILIIGIIVTLATYAIKLYTKGVAAKDATLKLFEAYTAAYQDGQLTPEETDTLKSLMLDALVKGKDFVETIKDLAYYLGHIKIVRAVAARAKRGE